MERKLAFGYSVRDVLVVGLPALFLAALVLVVAFRHLEPAPPDHLTISTGDDQGDLSEFAKQYQEILKQEGVRLDIRSSNGPFENLRRLQDDNSGVDAAFVQDGLGDTSAQPDVSSLGSLYYEPIWVFYRGSAEITHFAQLEGKRIAVGRVGHAGQVIASRLLKLSGVDPRDATLVNMDAAESMKALEQGTIDAAVIMRPPDDPIVRELATHPKLRLMNVLQAEAISRRDAAFHHLVLPRGVIDINNDIPRTDVQLVASTLTLLVRDDLHPALSYLLLKAASQIHQEPGVLERRGEFPTNKDDAFPLSPDAIQFYKSGGPFWQRYLPYWMAAWLDRFVLLVIPVLAFVIPLIRLVPKAYHWRLRTHLYQRYGELKFLETQIQPGLSEAQRGELMARLDLIEERVDRRRMPRHFQEYVYSLKGHIQFVRDRLSKMAAPL